MSASKLHLVLYLSVVMCSDNSAHCQLQHFEAANTRDARSSTSAPEAAASDYEKRYSLLNLEQRCQGVGSTPGQKSERRHSSVEAANSAV